MFQGYESLSPREREVLAVLVRGLGDKQIAAELGLSWHTARGYLRSAMLKTGAKSRVELAIGCQRWAEQTG